MRRLLLIGLVLAVSPIERAEGAAVTFQANAVHDGHAGAAGISPPLRRAWTARLDGIPSYPLIAGGRVFVILQRHTFNAPDPLELVALSARTGRVLWRRGLGAVYDAGLAYDAGRVFVSRSTWDEPGGLTAFDAAGGTVAWRTDVGSSSGDPPVAIDGIVYARVGIHGGWVTARRQADGGEIWQHVLGNGTNGAFAVTADAVYAALPCADTRRLRRSDGVEVWQTPHECAGGGGRAAVVGAGRVWGEENHGHELATGRVTSHWPAHYPPAFAGDLGLFPVAKLPKESLTFGHRLTAQTVATGRVRWSFRGDGYLDTAPLIAGRTAYVGSGAGRVFGVSLRTGRRVWRASVGAPVHGSGEGTGLIGGLAAADGLLVVPAHGRVTAFRD